MGNPGRLLAILALVAAEGTAVAHQSYLIPGVVAGSGSFYDFDIKGQWGITKTSPFYANAEMMYGAYPTYPRQDDFRFLIAVGVEGRRFGGDVHYENLNFGGYPATINHIGYSIRYRFVPFTSLSAREKETLPEAEKERLLSLREKDLNDSIPSAPVASLDYDAISYTSPLLTGTQLHSARAILALHWAVTPWWTVDPKVEAFTYEHQPQDDLAANTALVSPTLRLFHIGPFADGPYSGAYGTINSAQQIFSKVKMNPYLTWNAAVSRIQLNSPNNTGYSVYVAMERRFTKWEKWSITPAYEHFHSDRTFGFFSLFLRYNFDESYKP